MECSQNRGGKVLARAGDRGQAQPPSFRIVGASGCSDRLFEEAEGSPGVGSEGRTRRAEAQAPTLPDQQRHPDLLLEAGQGCGDGGLGDHEVFGCAADRAGGGVTSISSWS
jgi:hypothetical protein